MQISGRAPELSLEQREKRKLAKRIIKAIQPAFEDVVKKESELNGKPFEKELRDLDGILESSVLSRRGSFATELPNGVEKPVLSAPVNGSEEREDAMVTEDEPEPVVKTPGDAKPTAMIDKANGIELVAEDIQKAETSPDNMEQDGPHESAVDTPPDMTAAQVNGAKEAVEGSGEHEQAASMTPRSNSVDNQQRTAPMAQGGIPWYMQPFDPVGTTIHEERWTGRDVLRGMSEELSEMDEDEMQDLHDLVGDDMVGGLPGQAGRAEATGSAAMSPPTALTGSAKPRTRKRWKGFR
jgi:NuA3 HAT complex component NTO1